MAAKSTTYTVELQAVRLIPAVLGLERELVIEVIVRTPRLLSTSRRKHASAAVTLNAPQGAYVTWTQPNTARTYVRLRVLPEGRKAAAPLAAASSPNGSPRAPLVIETCKSTVAPLTLDEMDGMGQMRTLVVQLDRRAGLADERDSETGQQKQQGEGSDKECAAPGADGLDSPLVIAEVDVVIHVGRGGRGGSGSTATAARGAASAAPGSLSSGLTTAQAWAAMRTPNLFLPGQDPHGAVPQSPAGPPQPTPGSARKRTWLSALGLGLGRGSGGGAAAPTGTGAAGAGGRPASPTPMDCTSPTAASGGGALYAAGGGGSLLMPMEFPSSTRGAQSSGTGAVGLATAPGLRASGGLDLAAGPVGSRPTSASRRSGGNLASLAPREGDQPAMDAAAAARMHVPGYAPTGGGAAPGDAVTGTAFPTGRGKGPCDSLERSPFALESMDPGPGGAAAAVAGASLLGAPSLPSDPSSAPQHCASLADQPPKRRRLLGGLFARLFNSGPSRRLFSPSSAAAADSAHSSSTSTALASAAAAALAATGSGTAAAGTPRNRRDTATHGSVATPVGTSGRTTPTPALCSNSHLPPTSAGAPSGAAASTAPYGPALPRLSNGSGSTSLGRQRSLNALPLLVPPSPRGLGDVYRIPDNAAWAASSSPLTADPRGVGLNVGGVTGLMGPPAQALQVQPPAVISRGSGSASNGHLAPASHSEKVSGPMGATGEPAAGILIGSGHHGRDSEKDGNYSAPLLRGLESPGWGEMSPAAGPDRLLIEPPVDGLAAASLSPPPTAPGPMGGVSSPMAVTPAAAPRRLGPSVASGAAAAAASPVSAAGCFFPLWRSGTARSNRAASLLDSHTQQQDQQHRLAVNSSEAPIAGCSSGQAGTAATPAVRSGSGLGSRSFLGLGRGLRRAKDSARESGAGGNSQTPKAATEQQPLIVEGRGLGMGSGRLSTPTAAAAGTGGSAPASGGIGRGGSSGGGAAASGSSAAAAATAPWAGPGLGPAAPSPEPQAHPLEAEVRRVMAYVQGQRDIPEDLRAASVSQCQFLLDCLRSSDTCWLVGDSLLQLKHEVGFPFDSGVPIPGCHDWFRLVLQPTDLGVAVAVPSPAPAPASGALISSSSAGKGTGGAGVLGDAAPLTQQGGAGQQPKEGARCGGDEDSDEDVVVVGERQGQGVASGVGQRAGAHDSGPTARVPPLAPTSAGAGLGLAARGPEVLKVRWARIDQRQAGGANACAAIVLEVALWCLGAVARWRASAVLPTSLLGGALSARRASAGGRDHGGGGTDAYHYQHGKAGLFPPLGRSRSSNDRNEANRRASSDRGRVPADPRDGGGPLEAMSGAALEQCIRTGTAVWQSLLATSPAARVASSAGDFDLEHMLSLGGYGEKLRLAEYIAASLLDAPTPRPSATAIGLGGGPGPAGHGGRVGGAPGNGVGLVQKCKGGAEAEGLGRQLQANPAGSPDAKRASMEQQRLPPRPPRPQPLQIPGTAHPSAHTHSHHQPLPTARSAHGCMVGHGGGVPLFSSLVRSLPPGLYVLGFHGHFCALWLRPGGVVHLIDSLGSRLAVDCPMAFVAEFAELDEFLAFFAARHQVTRHDTAGLCDDITASNMAALIEVHRLELTTERTLG